MRLALFEPDIPQNTGAILRLGACLGVPVDIIEPCGFPFSHRALRRAGMDYLDQCDYHRHATWDTFLSTRPPNSRRLLLTTDAPTSYLNVRFDPDDTLILGRESAGVPQHVHQAASMRILIPMMPGTRSLNVALSAAIVVSEALRQLDGFPS